MVYRIFWPIFFLIRKMVQLINYVGANNLSVRQNCQRVDSISLFHKSLTLCTWHSMENGNFFVMRKGLKLIALETNLSFVPGGLMLNFVSILIQISRWLLVVRSCDGQTRGLDWNTICSNKNKIISQWPIRVWGTFVIRSIRLPHYTTQNNSSSLSTHPSQVQMIYGGDCQNLSRNLEPTNIKTKSL